MFVRIVSLRARSSTIPLSLSPDSEDNRAKEPGEPVHAALPCRLKDAVVGRIVRQKRSLLQTEPERAASKKHADGEIRPAHNADDRQEDKEDPDSVSSVVVGGIGLEVTVLPKFRAQVSVSDRGSGGLSPVLGAEASDSVLFCLR